MIVNLYIILADEYWNLRVNEANIKVSIQQGPKYRDNLFSFMWRQIIFNLNRKFKDACNMSPEEIRAIYGFP